MIYVVCGLALIISILCIVQQKKIKIKNKEIETLIIFSKAILEESKKEGLNPVTILKNINASLNTR